MKRCLIIFAKEPQRGRVKTRLEGYLSQTECVGLYKAFVRDSIDVAGRVQCEKKIVAYDSKNARPRYLKRIAPHFLFYKQKGRDLGQRMSNAFQFAKDSGFKKTVIIGTDSPTLPFHFIQEAFQKLSTHDFVIGPSADGGYYLIGGTRDSEGLFTGIRWSSDKVFKETLKRAKRLKKRAALLPQWYDVDNPLAMTRLMRDLKRDKKCALHTRKFFHRAGGSCEI